MLTSTILLTVAIALSQDQAGPLEIVQVTASRIKETTFETAQAVSVVDRATLEASAPQIVMDALRGLAGVSVQQTTPGQGIPIVRGLKGSEVLHLVDGFRLNNAFFRNAPNQYLALVDATQIEQMEVVRGPGSTLYGADALGGVVHILTREPEYTPNDNAWHGRLRGQFGSADQAVTVATSLTHGDGQNAYQLDLSYQDVGDRQTAAGTVRPSGYEARGAAVKWRHRDAIGGDWLVSLQHLRQPATPRVDELVPGFGQTVPDSLEFSFNPNQRNFAQLRYRRDVPYAWADGMEFHFGMQEIVDDRSTRGFASTTRQRERNKSQLWGITGQIHRALGPTAALVYGADFYHDEVTSSRAATDLLTNQTFPIQARFPDGSRQTSLAAYAQTLWDITATSEIRAGLRYSTFEIDIAKADRESGQRLRPDKLSASVGLHHSLSESLVLVANIGQGFRAPNIFDLSTLGPRPGGRFNVANPQLQPEELISVDLGLKWRSALWQGELAAFHAAFDDKITSVPTGAIIDNRVVVQSSNVTEVDLWGIEFGLRRVVGEHGQFYSVVNWTRGEESDPSGEQPADRIPPLNGRVGFRHRIAANWNADLHIDFARRQDRLSMRDRGDPRIDPEGTPGWATLNLRTRWQASPHWDLGLAWENMLDRRYREHGSGIDARGRNFALSFNRRF